MKLEDHIKEQMEWSLETFGPGERLDGVLDHIRKELGEIEETKGKDLEEWADAMLLVMDGMWRQGYSPDEITAMIEWKFIKNRNRKWPDWRTQDPGKAIHHEKE